MVFIHFYSYQGLTEDKKVIKSLLSDSDVASKYRVSRTIFAERAIQYSLWKQHLAYRNLLPSDHVLLK